MTDNNASEAERRPDGCACSHEQGDSDCPIHVQCSECGADISHQRVVTSRRALASQLDAARGEIERCHDMEARKDAAYTERNQVVAALAKAAIQLGWRAGLGEHQPDPDPSWSADWLNVVYIEMPTGQVSWHIHDSHLPIFDDLPQYAATWDGHTTKVTAEVAAQIIALKASGSRAVDIAAKFAVNKCTVERVLNGKHYATADTYRARKEGR